jgi:hypothetical protein
MEQYQAIMAAIAVLHIAKLSQDVIGVQNPAWVMLLHAGDHLKKQANDILRGEL